MKGTIIFDEKRSVVDNFKKWYEVKLIDTGLAAKFEEDIDKNIALEKKRIVIAGTVATVVLFFIPVDGPFGEIATLLATPGLVKLVDLKGKFMKKVVIAGKRKMEADFIKADGSSKKVIIPDGNIVKDFKEGKEVYDILKNRSV